MKIIFLDIDGVLNYEQWYDDDRNPGNLNDQESDIDPLCVERVVRICEETGAKVVISSDWKLNMLGTVQRLVNMGLPENLIFGKTPDYCIFKLGNKYWSSDVDGYEFSRGHEIDLWLDSHPECNNYVILDDRTDFTEEQKIHFIQINPTIGLTDDNVSDAIITLKAK